MDRVKAEIRDRDPNPMQIQRSGPRRWQDRMNHPMAIISSDLDGLICCRIKRQNKKIDGTAINLSEE